jgi:hypothetical protein
MVCVCALSYIMNDANARGYGRKKPQVNSCQDIKFALFERSLDANTDHKDVVYLFLVPHPHV